MNNKFTRGIFDAVLMLVGAAIAASAMNIFLIPYNIAPGGASGIGLIVSYLTNGMLSVGLIILVVNIPLFIIGFKSLGVFFTIKSILGTVLLSLFIDYFVPMTDYISTNVFMIDPNGSNWDLLLFAVYGGLLLGFGLGLVIKAGASTGGTDLAAQLMNKAVPHISMGVWLLLFDVVIVIVAAAAFKNALYTLYAVISLSICSKTMDIVVEGINHAKMVYIISDKSEEIGEKIMNDIQRGVTALSGEGLYSREGKDILLVVVYNRQLQQLKRLINSIDRNAFVILSDAREVLGEGFKNKKIN